MTDHAKMVSDCFNGTLVFLTKVLRDGWVRTWDRTAATKISQSIQVGYEAHQALCRENAALRLKLQETNPTTDKDRVIDALLVRIENQRHTIQDLQKALKQTTS